MHEPDAHGFVALPAPIDLALTLGPIAHGRGDPTIRFGPDGIWRSTRTPVGPATIRLQVVASGVEVSAWGAGAAEAIAGAPDLVGANDDPTAFVPHHRLIGELVHRFPGLRLPRTNRPFEALLPAICEQKVPGVDARDAFRGIIASHGEDAPGPAGMRLPPAPGTLAALPYFAFHRFGLERRRADLIRITAQLASRIEGATPTEAHARLEAIPGIGPWTLAEVGRIAFGDPDALSVGDYHLPNVVAWALLREPRADDARMLELLEPYRGQRGRVQRLLEVSGIGAPRYGPRMAAQPIAEI
ncbi:MAG: DNA-3-methyladenine glycosylase 2 family protein [Chloroflexota bacterium]